MGQGLVFKIMEIYILVNGKMENIMDKGLLHGQLERLIREILKKIKETVEEYLFIKMEIDLMGNGNKTKNVVQGILHGKMAKYTQENIKTVRGMEKAR